MNYVSKVVVIVENRYVMSIKKSPLKSEKDKRLEFFGGNCDGDETAFEGLLRELKEEESSGVLSKKAGQLKLKPVKEFLLDDKMQVIYQMEITFDEYNQLNADHDESYGITTVPVDYFNTPKQVDLDKFTPKTVLILKKLEII